MPYDTNRKARFPRNWHALRGRILKRDARRCQLRYARICTEVATQVDHIDRNGGDDETNLQAVCRECHLKKSAAEATEARRRIATSRYREPEPHPGVIR